MNEILKQFTPNNIAGGSYERLSIVSLINVLTGEPLNININGQMNMGEAQDLLFNLIALFRVFLAMQQPPHTDEPTI